MREHFEMYRTESCTCKKPRVTKLLEWIGTTASVYGDEDSWFPVYRNVLTGQHVVEDERLDEKDFWCCMNCGKTDYYDAFASFEVDTDGTEICPKCGNKEGIKASYWDDWSGEVEFECSKCKYSADAEKFFKE